LPCYIKNKNTVAYIPYTKDWKGFDRVMLCLSNLVTGSIKKTASTQWGRSVKKDHTFKPSSWALQRRRDWNKSSSPWIAGKYRTLDRWRWSRPLGSLQNDRADLIKLQRSQQKSISFDCYHQYSRADSATKSKRTLAGHRAGRAATAVKLIEDERADSAQSNSSRMNEEERRWSGLVEDEQRGTEKERQKSWRGTETERTRWCRRRSDSAAPCSLLGRKSPTLAAAPLHACERFGKEGFGMGEQYRWETKRKKNVSGVITSGIWVIFLKFGLAEIWKLLVYEILELTREISIFSRIYFTLVPFWLRLWIFYSESSWRNWTKYTLNAKGNVAENKISDSIGGGRQPSVRWRERGRTNGRKRRSIGGRLDE
jgi:hypothetical protein